MIAEVEYLAVTRWHIGEGEPNNGDHRQPVNPDSEDAGQIGTENRHIAEARADQRIGQSRERSPCSGQRDGSERSEDELGMRQEVRGEEDDPHSRHQGQYKRPARRRLQPIGQAVDPPG